MLRPVARALLAALALATGATPAQAAERMAGQQDSHVAVVLLILSGLIAAGLATAAPRRHRLGVTAGGLALVAGALSLLWAQRSGQFASLEPPETPLDAIKAPILLVQAAAAGAAGLFLVTVGLKMPTVAADQQIVPVRNGTAAYGRVSRILHWTIGIIILSLIPMGIFMAGLPDGAALRDPLYIVHKSLGLVVLLLAVGRVAWHFTNRPPALSPGLGRGNRRAAKTAHILLYVLMIGFPVTGYFMSSFAGKTIPFFYIDLMVWLEPSKDSAMPFGLLHKFALPILFYLTFAAHVGGVLWHHFRDRDKLAIKRIAG